MPWLFGIQACAFDNRYVIGEGHKVGYIDSLGNIAIPPQFDDGADFSEGLAAVEVGREYYFYRRIDDTSGYFIPVHDDSLFLIDKEEYVITNHGPYGFIDTTGRLVIFPEFDYAFDFSEGWAVVNRGGEWGDEGILDGGIWTYIGRTGGVHRTGFFEFKDYDNAQSFSEARAAVDSAGKWGYINSVGELEFNYQFDYAGPFEYGFAECRYDERGDYFWIDKRGEVYTDLRYFSEGFLIKNFRGKYGVFDSLGNELVAPKFDYLGPFVEGRAQVRDAGKWGFIAPNGNYVCEPRFDEVENYSSGMALVQLDKKWGYINHSGDVAITPQYGHAKPFKGALSGVVTTEKIILPDGKESIHAIRAYINKRGEIVWPKRAISR